MRPGGEPQTKALSEPYCYLMVAKELEAGQACLEAHGEQLKLMKTLAARVHWLSVQANKGFDGFPHCGGNLVRLHRRNPLSPQCPFLRDSRAQDYRQRHIGL